MNEYKLECGEYDGSSGLDGAVDDDGCVFSNQDVVDIRREMDIIKKCSVYHQYGAISEIYNVLIRGSAYDLTPEDYTDCYWDLWSLPLSENTAYQRILDLKTKTEDVLSTSTSSITDYESIALDVVLNDISYIEMLVRTGHLSSDMGDFFQENFWYNNPVASHYYAMLSVLLTDVSTKPGFGDMMVRIHSAFDEFLPAWKTAMERGVAENITMPAFAAEGLDWESIFLFDYKQPCQLIGSSAERGLCISKGANINSQLSDQYQYFTDVYVPHAKLVRPDTKPGKHHMPHGKEVYEGTLKFHNGPGHTSPSNMVHDGITRLNTNKQEVVQIFQNLDSTVTSYNQVVQQLSNPDDPRFYICTGDFEEVISANSKMLYEASSNVLDVMGYMSPISLAIEPFSSTAFLFSGYDGERNFYSYPGIYLVQTMQGCTPTSSNPGGLYYDKLNRAIVIHEAEPGHARQIIMNQEASVCSPVGVSDIPTASAEGWGMYAENALGYEMGRSPSNPRGLYTDPVDEISHKYFLGLRLIRRIVGPRIHSNETGYPSLSIQECIDFMKQEGAFTTDLATAECRRYVLLPGQATAYIEGSDVITALRQKAQSDLGAKFSKKEFHNIVTRFGSMILRDLEALMDTWIAYTENPNDASLSGMFGIDMVREQFSRTLPSPALGRIPDPSSPTVASARSLGASTASKSTSAPSRRSESGIKGNLNTIRSHNLKIADNMSPSKALGGDKHSGKHGGLSSSSTSDNDGRRIDSKSGKMPPTLSDLLKEKIQPILEKAKSP